MQADFLVTIIVIHLSLNAHKSPVQYVLLNPHVLEMEAGVPRNETTFPRSHS